MLLAGSSVLLRGFMAMQQVVLGVPADRVLTMRVPLSAQRYPDPARRIAFFRELLGRVSAVPGVAAVAVNSGLHPIGNMWTAAEVSGEAPSNDPVQVHSISAQYPNVVGIRLAAGRILSEADVNGPAPVALVNERFALTRLPGRAPLGQVVRLPRLAQAPFAAANVTFEIVGVVHDAVNAGLMEPTMPEIYIPFTATGMSDLIAVRSDRDPAAITRAVVGQVYAVDPGQPVTAVMTLDAILRDSEYATPRFNLILLSVFATVGLALAVAGVYGVMSSAVAQERQEIGIRMALGADAGAIARMVIGRGSRLLLAGTVLGLAGSVAAGRLLAREVWNVSPFDPIAFGVVTVMLLAVGVLACALPARRAMRVDPMVALRHE
jgi:putative ABC transport system permease protein